MSKSSTGMEENVAGLLCYILGWVTGLIFLLIEKDSKFVKFHAIQSIVVFGALSVLSLVIRIIFIFSFWVTSTLLGILGLIAFILWIVLMVKAYQGAKFKLPISGDIAEKNS